MDTFNMCHLSYELMSSPMSSDPSEATAATKNQPAACEVRQPASAVAMRRADGQVVVGQEASPVQVIHRYSVRPARSEGLLSCSIRQCYGSLHVYKRGEDGFTSFPLSCT